MPPPPTRKEQLQLDELLSDIYRGIEALPDRSVSAYGGNGTGTYGTYQFNKSSAPDASSSQLVGRSHVREYELPASSPLVKQHLAALREDLQPQQTATSRSYHSSTPTQSNYDSTKQPQRSTLKRSATSNTPDIYNSVGSSTARAAPQSLASFVTSTPTPENKRRVRIVDHPQSLGRKNNNNNNYLGAGRDEESDYAGEENDHQRRWRPEKVKYVNTNKLIYHQERNPDDDDDDYDDDQPRSPEGRNPRNSNDADDDDDLDGKTRVEYYHTTWLDRQLGRASKRRSSKELNERQVKEKAMIEELKRSLKSGAITLRQSLKGKKNTNKQSNSDSFNNSANKSNFADDYQIDSAPDSHTSSSGQQHHHHSSPSKYHQHKSNPIGSGLATIPRNYGKVSYQATPVCYDTWVNKTRGSTSPTKSDHSHHHQHNHRHHNKPHQSSTVIVAEEPRNSYYTLSSSQPQRTAPKQTSSGDNFLLNNTNTLSNNNNNNNINNSNNFNNYNSNTLDTRMQHQHQMRQPAEQTPSSLYSRTLPHKSRRGEHSLIESHLRGSGSRNYTLDRQPSSAVQPASGAALPYSAPSVASTARNQETPTTNSMRNPGYASPAGGLRSPTNSCLDHQQLRQRPGGETINNIPSATEVVRSALSRSSSQVSLNQMNKTINLLPNSPPPYSPSPSGQTPTQQLRSPAMSPSPAGPRCPVATNRPSAYTSNSTTATPQRLTGTRTLDRNATVDQQQPSRPTIYANSHASLMQHKAEQQAKQPNPNTASIREFNELDNLLRSLSPAASQYQSSANITPGFSAKPAQPSIGGYGFTAPAAPTVAPNKPNAGGNELYARVQRPPATSIYQTPAANDQTKASYLHQNYALANQQQQQTHQPFTIDVTTNKRADENCYKRQELSEFEAPIELLPSMEDYQNITKLNPVKNHYWYKPNMSRDRAISLLKDKPQGTFIVRDSTSFRGAYGLALKVAKLPKNVLNNASLRNYNSNDPSAELIRHFLIEPTTSGVRLKGYENEPVFNSLPDLIYQHSLTELALPCRLIIPRADIEDSNFNLKQKQFFDDFVASKEQAKHLPYERTSPNGGYRKYPGDVYVHNEHRIIFE